MPEKEKTRSHKAKKVIERMGKKLNRQLVGSLVACVHCGMCTQSCHYVLANPDDPHLRPRLQGRPDSQDFQTPFRLDGADFPLVGESGGRVQR